MKKFYFANFISPRNKWLKGHLLLLVIFMSVLNGMNAQQVIGSFPYMNGGFEGQAAGALVKTTLSSPALSATNWTQVQTAGLSTSIATLSPRTGVNYATSTVVSGPTTSNNRVLQGPQLQPFNAAASPTASTAYVFQYWVRNAATVATFAVSVNTNGVANNGYITTDPLPIHSDWTKIVTPVTTSSTAITSSGALVLKSLVGTFDVDDIVIYAGTTADDIAPDPVTSPSAPTSVATQMNVSWNAPATGVDGGGYMVVRGVSDPTTTPNANGIYAVGNFVAGSEKVVYLGTTPSFTDLLLSPSTTYYYRIYTVDKAFNYSTPVSISGTTAAPSFAAEPTTQASGISFANVSSTGFDINWTNGNGANSLVVIHSGSVVNSDPVDGNTFTANTIFGSGSQIGSGNYVVYNGTGSNVTVTGLSKATTYYVSIYSFNGSGGTENYKLTPATGNQLASPGEISSTGANSLGSSWAVGSSWNGGVVPGPGDNVTIASGDKINVASSQSCYNLTINSGGTVYNNTALPATPLYLTVYGTSLVCNGTLGDKTIDGLSDGALGINFNNNLTISGSGLLRPARIRPNAGVSNLTLTIDADMQILYNGTSGTGGAALYTDNGGDNITVIVNTGRILSFASGSNFNSNALSATNGAASTTITINGIVNVNSNANFSMPIASGKTYTLNVNGALNIGNFNATSSTGGGVPTVNVGPAGSISVSGIADFSNTSLSAYVGGTGSFTLNSGGTINIAAATGLEPAAGPIRTTTRNFSTSANYSYLGIGAQVTGSELPATVNNLTINNATGVTLSNATTVNGALTFTTGTLSLGTNNLTLGTIGSISGASATSFIVTNNNGKLVQSVAAGTAKVFPIGVSVTSYDPVTLTPTNATNFSANVYTTLPSVAPSNYSYNEKVWDLTPVTPSSTVVSLTPSIETASGANTVIGHYVVNQYENIFATYAAGNYSATFNSFSPFVTGKTDLSTAVNELNINALSVYSDDNQLIIKGLNPGDIISIYALNGIQMKSLVAQSNQCAVNLSQGVYFVKIKSSKDSNVFKVMLK